MSKDYKIEQESARIARCGAHLDGMVQGDDDGGGDGGDGGDVDDNNDEDYDEHSTVWGPLGRHGSR